MSQQNSISLEELQNDYDWGEVFTYANGVCESPRNPVPPFGSPKNFDRSDVSWVVASRPGENDGRDWKIVVRLNDGRYGYIEAGCDYTGWDCQAGGSSVVADSLSQLVTMGMPLASARELGLECLRTDR